MKRSRLLPALGLLSGVLWGCFSDKVADPLSSDTVEELQRKGSISGTVTDASAGLPSAGSGHRSASSVNHGISGVAVTLDSGGYATNTDSLGHYTIPPMSPDAPEPEPICQRPDWCLMS